MTAIPTPSDRIRRATEHATAGPKRLPPVSIPYKGRLIRACVALQAIVAGGLLALVLSTWPRRVAPAAPPPAPIEAPPSIRSVEEPVLILPDTHKPRARGAWM